MPRSPRRTRWPSLDSIAQQVRSAGITQVRGNVVVDPRLFTAGPPLDPAPTPMIVNDNVIDLLTTPTAPGQTAQLFWRPQVAPYQVTSDVRTVPASGTTDIQVSADPDGTRITLSGTIAADAAPVLRISHVQDPNAFARTALIEALARAASRSAPARSAPTRWTCCPPRTPRAPGSPPTSPRRSSSTPGSSSRSATTSAPTWGSA
ncbi:D-alanyl-D-alanine carboxypeptidase [Kitasatospora arboriphila]